MNSVLKVFGSSSIVRVFCVFVGFWLLLSQPLNAGSLNKDIVLVVDNSGSMKINDPDKLASRALLNFIQQLTPNDRVSLQVFGKTTEIVLPLSLVNARLINEIPDLLASIDYSGQWTNSPAAIERAIYELTHGARKDSQKSILFLTDGLVDTGDPEKDRELSRWAKEQLATQAADAGIRIFAIAFSDQADFILIQTLAQKTKGSYFRVLKAANLDQTFEDIMALLSPVIKEEIEVEQITLVESPPTKNLTSAPTPAASHRAPELPNIGKSKAQETPDKWVNPPYQQLTSQSVKKASGGFMMVGGIVVVLLTLIVVASLWYRTRKQAHIPEFDEALSEDDRDTFVAVKSVENSLVGGPAKGDADIATALPIPRATMDTEDPSMDATISPRDLRAYLEDNGGITGRTEYPLTRGLTIIGRIAGPGANKERYIVIDDALVSRRHATITYRDFAYWISDQGSSNGTYVNDNEVTGLTYLKHGDVIRIARFEFTFCMPTMEVGEETIKFGIE